LQEQVLQDMYNEWSLSPQGKANQGTLASHNSKALYDCKLTRWVACTQSHCRLVVWAMEEYLWSHNDL